MEKLTNFKNLKKKAETASQKLRQDLYEEELAYNGIMPQYNESGDLYKDPEYYRQDEIISTYMTADYQVSVDTYSESMFFKLPTIRMNAAKGVMTIDDRTAINSELRRISMLADLDKKIMSVLRTGIRKAYCVCELVPKSIKASGYVGNIDSPEEFETLEEQIMDLIVYDPMSTYIDPNADPDNVRKTAQYCIVDLGKYSMEVFKKMCKENGWKVDYSKVSETSMKKNPYTSSIRSIEGVEDSEGVLISKLFTNDGYVQVVFNNEYALPKTINQKRIKEMPLIFYNSIPGANTPYGRLYWNMIKLSVVSKSALASVILDAVGKNYSMPTITTNKDLQNRNWSDYGKDDFIYVMPGSDPIEKQFFNMKYTDMTLGAQYAIGQFDADITKISKLSSVDFGFQDKGIRTDGIAAQLKQPSLTKNSSLVKQFEQTFMRDFVRDFWWILVSYYDKYDIKEKINFEKLKSISSITCVNGSTLEQDQMTQLEILQFALEYIRAFADSNYSVDKILDALFEQVGWVDADNYKLSPAETLAKMLIMHYGMDPQTAVQMAKASIEQIDQAISNQGAVQQ